MVSAKSVINAQGRILILCCKQEMLRPKLTLTIFTIVSFAVINGEANTISPAMMSRVKASLQSALGDTNIPKQVTIWMAVLHKTMNIHNCRPTTRINTNCHSSPGYCVVPKLKILRKPFVIKLSICKKPWKFVIKTMFHLQHPKLPFYARARFKGLVIRINALNDRGMAKVTSFRRGTGTYLGGSNDLKAALKINAIVRWDCTKPTLYDWMRAVYNRGYDGEDQDLDYNKHYYKFHLRFELMKKQFPCFCFRCFSCEDVVKKKGVFGEGPKSCIRDTVSARPRFQPFQRILG